VSEATTAERMVACAARALRDGEVVFVGIGLPNLACNLARLTHAPRLVLLYESGAVGAVPERLPLSIGDPALAAGCTAVAPMADVFHLILQGGRIDVGFLGGAEIDRFGNLNTTVIGEYARPKVRLPGSGGACEIAIHSKRVVVIGAQQARSFPERVDFRTSPGHAVERGGRSVPGAGPRLVITDLGVYDFETPTREMRLASIHPGVTLEKVRENLGWDVAVARPLATTDPPTAEEIAVLRGLDPKGLYLS
jgi:glutaconate CoA-transferase subunit B